MISVAKSYAGSVYLVVPGGPALGLDGGRPALVAPQSDHTVVVLGGEAAGVSYVVGLQDGEC